MKEIHQNRYGVPMSRCDQALQQVEFAKLKFVDSLAPGTRLTERLNEIQKRIYDHNIDLSAVTANDISLIISKSGRKTKSSQNTLQEITLKTIANGHPVGPALVEESLRLENLLRNSFNGTLQITELDLNESTRILLGQRAILESLRHENPNPTHYLWKRLVGSLTRIGMDKMTAEATSKAARESLPAITAAREKDRKSGDPQIKYCPADQFWTALRNEATTIDRLNSLLWRLDELVRTKQGAILEAADQESFLKLTENGITSDIPSDEIATKAKSFGLSHESSLTYAQSVMAARKRRKQRAYFRRPTSLDLAREIATRFDNPTGRTIKPLNIVTQFSKKVLAEDSRIDYAEFSKEMAKLEINNADIETAWEILNQLTAVRAEVRRLRLEATAANPVNADKSGSNSENDNSGSANIEATLPFIIHEVFNHPGLNWAIRNQERITFQAQLFYDWTELDLIGSYRAANALDSIIKREWMGYRMKLVEDVLASYNSPAFRSTKSFGIGKSQSFFDCIYCSVESTVERPETRIITEFARLNGWKDLNDRELCHLVRLDAFLDDSEASQFDIIRNTNEIILLLRNSAIPVNEIKVITDLYLKNLVERIPDWALSCQFHEVSGNTTPTTGDEDKRRQDSISTWFLIAGTILAFLAIADLPHSYYALVRWSTFSVAIASAIKFYRVFDLVWILALCVFAVLFNPLFPMDFDRETWKFLDGCAGFLFLCILLLRRTVGK